MRTLVLTSPYMKGSDVLSAQKMLKRAGYYKSTLDSLYGPLSASATKAYKWDIGYAESDINGAFDDTVSAYLDGKKPSILMRRRAKERAKKQTLGETALDVAGRFIGMSEQPPGSNIVVFSNWYGMRGPWCAMFVTYCFVQAKSKAFIKGKKYAYCPYILSDARGQHNNLRIVSTADAAAGDIVLFDWDGDGVADHVGLVSTPPGNKRSFSTIEGNTSGTNPSDGGMVARMTRSTRDVIAFVRVLN